jgi:hypothetical protein
MVNMCRDTQRRELFPGLCNRMMLQRLTIEAPPVAVIGGNFFPVSDLIPA